MEFWHGRWGGYVRAALLVLATVLVYANSFDVAFQFDDYINIVKNPFLSTPEKIINPGPVPDPDMWELHARRTLGYLSLSLNYKLHGLEVWGYHAVNLLIHLASVLLVYVFVGLLFKTPRARGSALASRASTLAFLCALVFAVHPIQTQAVTYIVQRFASMVAMFYLASLVLYLKARMSEKTLSRNAYSVLMALAAMKTKENAITLPIAAAMLEWVFFPAEPIKKRMAWLGALMLTALVIPTTVILQHLDISDLQEMTMKQTRLGSDMPRSTYFFTELRVIVTYLRLLVLPINQNLDYDYPLYESFLSAPVVLSFGFLSAMLAAGVLMLRRTDGAWAVVGFGILWFFLTLSVESSFLPIVDVIFEHRVYLPSVGVICAAVVGASYVAARGKWFGLAVVLILLAACVLGVMAHNRNEIWRDSIRLWQDTASKSPNKARPRFNLGLSFYEKGYYEQAIEHFKRAAEIDPWTASIFNSLGASYYSADNDDLAIASYLKALELEPYYVECMVNLAKAYRHKGLKDKALSYYQRALRHEPEDYDINLSMAKLLLETSRWDEAERTARSLIALYPDKAASLNGMLSDIEANRQPQSHGAGH